MGLFSGLFGKPSFSAQGPSKGQLKAAYQQVQDSIAQQKNFVTALQAQNGLTNQANVFAQQQGLADQLQGMTQGEGPNPALAALNQATGQNVANQAALMAGQRGASANAGLIARQAGQQGANTQQQAIGQAATLQAQQQLAAIGALQQQQQQMAGLAGNQVGQQQTGLQTLGQLTGNNQGQLLGAQSNANQINASMAQQQNGFKAALLGRLAGAAGTAIAGPLGGGIAKKVFSSFSSPEEAMLNSDTIAAAEGGEIRQPRSMFARQMYAKGGAVKAMVSPGEKYLSPSDVNKVAQGANPMKVGVTVPGKPKVGGAKNSYANDTVPATLEEGGIVIPRSITKSKNPDKKAQEFIAAILKKKL